MEVARKLGISRNAVIKWTGEAGIEVPPRRPCGICAHPRRDEIDLALLEGSVDAARKKLRMALGTKSTMLDRHRRLHMGMPVGRGYGAYPTCKVCDHPDREAIDEALVAGESRSALARRYDNAFSRNILKNHLDTHINNPRRDAIIAAVNALRADAIRRIEERQGPPRGWLFCPECDSDNVRSAGSGYWRDDPGPIHWHVTECFDCGFPEVQP